MKSIIVTGSARTPIGGFMGRLSHLSAVELGALSINESIRRAHVDRRQINEVIMGHVITAGLGQSTARQAALKAHLSHEVPAYTVNNVCGSSLRAIMLASAQIKALEGEVYLVGGMESMSQAPHILHGYRQGKKLGHQPLDDAILSDGLIDPLLHIHMGVTAENIAKLYDISREEQDIFALESQRKAEIAQNQGYLQQELFELPTLMQDEGLRHHLTLDKLGKLKPAFIDGGTVTPGNSSSLNDGAATLLVMDEDYARREGIKKEARILGYEVIGFSPEIMGLAPAYATKRLLKRFSMTIDDIDIIEANEAFAAQAIAVGRELKWNYDKVNIHGGAIALGHPLGASGARIVVTLIHALKRKQCEYGVAMLCIGGGMGIAMLIQNMNDEE